ncbi:MAG TPA: mercuric reductase [Steroidobacter sp.]|nr:mercuric reductase [Steroidobacter sp.]
MAEHYDFLVIGGGQGGIPLARALAAAGKRVALAERKHLGGSCVNFGCTPTKAAFASARVAHLARRASDYGIEISSMSVDFPKVLDRAQRIALESRARLQDLLEWSGNPQLLRGHARFMERTDAGFKISVDQLRVTAREVVLDTGTRSAKPQIQGIAGADFITSENWLTHRELPRTLLVIGGGYIGLEMGQFYRRMGSEVTIIESSAQVLPQEDQDVAIALQRALEAEGVRFLMNARLTGVSKLSQGVSATVSFDGGSDQVTAAAAFLALGRQPNTDELGLDLVGVHATDKGIVQVDERLATSTPGIWAMGDIRGGPMFTHTSWDDYRILESQLIGDRSRTLERIAPYAVFTDPELGRVGMTEKQARALGHDVKVGHLEMRHNGKARENGETRGFVKLVTHAADQRLLGAAILSVEAAELVHLYVELMNTGMPYQALERAIYIHPTLSEATQSAIATIH